MLADWELDLFRVLARHDLLLARARADDGTSLHIARVQLLLATRARRHASDELRLLAAVELSGAQVGLRASRRRRAALCRVASDY